jgi:hypothetical protein
LYYGPSNGSGGITLQVCRFLNGCEGTPIYDGPSNIAFNRCSWPNSQTNFRLEVRHYFGGHDSMQLWRPDLQERL